VFHEYDAICTSGRINECGGAGPGQRGSCSRQSRAAWELGVGTYSAPGPQAISHIAIESRFVQNFARPDGIGAVAYDHIKRALILFLLHKLRRIVAHNLPAQTTSALYAWEGPVERRQTI
jgi:hypothetical protein